MSTEHIAPGVNPEAIKTLSELFGENFDALLESFLQNTQDCLTQLEAALHNNQSVEASELAHKLVSSTGLFGMMRLSALAKELEHADTHAGTAACMPLFHDIMQEFSNNRDKVNFKFKGVN